MRKIPDARSDGFSLVEVLIALVVLAIGLLGLASLQTQSLRFNHDAYVRSQATLLAFEMIDRMRLDIGTDFSLVAAAGACNATDATPAEALCLWQQDLAARLPTGRGLIQQNADPGGNHFDVIVQWRDREIDAQGDCVVLGNTTRPVPTGLPGRVWDPAVGANGACFVQQVWTVRIDIGV